MMKPRGLRSNTPSVHIDKDRGNEAIVLRNIEKEITVGIEKMQNDLGIKQESYSTLYHIGGVLMALSLLAMCIVVAAHYPRARAQNPTSEQIFAPMEVFCTGANKHIKNVLSKTGMFKDAFALSGEGARQVSKNVFNHLPPADHIIIIRQTSGGSIMVPCVLGKKGPEWDGKQSNRVTVDFVFKNELDNPKTELQSGRTK